MARWTGQERWYSPEENALELLVYTRRSDIVNADGYLMRNFWEDRFDGNNAIRIQGKRNNNKVKASNESFLVL
jgi:hypothetical protein